MRIVAVRATDVNTFGKADRLLRTKEFQRVFSERKSASSGCLIVYAAPNSLGRSRLGLSIGKQAGESVTRNRIKRLVREVFRTAGESVPDGFDFVVVARKNPCQWSYEAVESSLLKLAADAARRWNV
jgi:ribonuclease P protein component